MSFENSEDVLNILIATDNHLGFAEKDVIRGKDSFVTFEEILQLARKHDVDMVLLGGDLFHEANPSSYALSQCIQLLKQYCVGDKPVSIQFLSDQTENFAHLKNPIVNYEDPSLNIALPVFSIHGNHDDPTGINQISALNILSNTGLINYFGRQNNLTDIVIKPLLLAKGQTKIAIYGLSHIRDERLGRLFVNRQISTQKPDGDDWFHLMVVHQNRVERGTKNFVPASFLPKYLDLVLWGHEHDCYIEEQKCDGIYITQPGSSVATSLASGESRPKHVGLLKINGTKFQLLPIPLQTVRPFFYEELRLDAPNSSLYSKQNPSVQAMNTVEKAINALLEKSAEMNAGTVRESMLPLVRIIALYKDERQAFNCIKFNQMFVNKIANPKDAVLLKLYKDNKRTQKQSGNSRDLDNDDGADSKIEELILEDFSNAPLNCLSAPGLVEALKRFVTVNDTEALKLDISKQMEIVLKKLVEKDPSEEEMNDCLSEIVKEIEPEMIAIGLNQSTTSSTINRPLNANGSAIHDLSSDEDMDLSVALNVTRGGRGTRGRGRGRGRRRART